MVFYRASNSELTKVLAQIKGSTLMEEEQIREAISNSGLIDKLADKIKSKGASKATIESVVDRKSPKAIQLTILKGRALVGLNNMDLDPSCSLQVHIQYENARHTTKSVISQLEPIFNDVVTFELPTKDLNILADLNHKIHLVLVQKSASLQTTVIGVAQIEWRKVLHAGRISSLVELKDSSHSQMTVGILDISLQFLPLDGERMRRDEVDFNLNRQEKRRSDNATNFYLSAKTWWNDYLQIRSSHSTRLVKIFANNEFGGREPVTSFVCPLSCRWIETPRHAARFVSLIDFQTSPRVGDSATEVWPNLHTVLVAGKGDIQDHCLLLCSLLLGFHLDVYVTIGTNNDNTPHMWVTTVDARGIVVFWEALTGIQYGQMDKHHFRTIGCCFNAKDLYANIQVTDGADRIKFRFVDPAQWKHLATDHMRNESNNSLTFLRPSIDVIQIEMEVEETLRQLIEYYRIDHRLTCIWDESLADLCGQSLWSMENGKLSGQSQILFSDDFRMGVKKSIPDGHTFKGYPHCFSHIHPHRIMQTLLQMRQSREVVVARGDVVRMAVRTKVVVYAEGVVACWVMVGARALF